MLSSMTRIAAVLFALGWLGAAHGQASPMPPTPATDSDSIDEAAQEQLLQQAVDQIKAGAFDDAIHGPLAQIIHTYETTYAHSKKQIYCAESMTETLLYMGMASENHKDAIVLAKPTWAIAYYLRGYAYNSLGKFADAEASLNQALALSPFNSQFKSELGNTYENEKNWPKALDTFQSADTAAIAAGADNMKVTLRCRALRGQGYVYVELHQLDDATKAYHQCLTIQPGDPASLRELGYVQGLRDKGAK
jgi:tetratricopeptide (TPR) repeat protein